jgi:hypothetical protein
LPPEVFRDYFGTDDHQALWQELNSSSDHREWAIAWLDAMISIHVTDKLKEMNGLAQALKV